MNEAEACRKKRTVLGKLSWIPPEELYSFSGSVRDVLVQWWRFPWNQTLSVLSLITISSVLSLVCNSGAWFAEKCEHLYQHLQGVLLHDFFSLWTKVLSILSPCLQNRSNLCCHSYKKVVDIYIYEVHIYSDSTVGMSLRKSINFWTHWEIWIMRLRGTCWMGKAEMSLISAPWMIAVNILGKN